MAEILKEILGKFKVLLIVRRQDDWCESLYNQLVFKENRYAKYISFCTMFAQAGTTTDYGAIRELDWFRLAKIYIELVGAENITVLPYESLSEWDPMFFGQLSNFFDQSVSLSREIFSTKDNPREPNRTYQKSTISELVKRCAGACKRGEYERMGDVLKEITSRMAGKKVSSEPAYITLDVEARGALMAEVAGANRELQSIVADDLRRYGYY